MIVIELWGVIIGDPKGGVWCGACSLPSGFIYQFATGSEDIVMSACRHFICPDCGSHVHIDRITLDELDGGPIELSWAERCG